MADPRQWLVLADYDLLSTGKHDRSRRRRDLVLEGGAELTERGLPIWGRAQDLNVTERRARIPDLPGANGVQIRASFELAGHATRTTLIWGGDAYHLSFDANGALGAWHRRARSRQRVWMGAEGPPLHKRVSRSSERVFSVSYMFDGDHTAALAVGAGSDRPAPARVASGVPGVMARPSGDVFLGYRPGPRGGPPSPGRPAAYLRRLVVAVPAPKRLVQWLTAPRLDAKTLLRLLDALGELLQAAPARRLGPGSEKSWRAILRRPEGRELARLIRDRQAHRQPGKVLKVVSQLVKGLEGDDLEALTRFVGRKDVQAAVGELQDLHPDLLTLLKILRGELGV